VSFWLLACNVGLAGYNAGSMWTLQLMHYPLYASIGAGELRAYIEANNRSAVLPAIVPALAFLVVSILTAALTRREARAAAVAQLVASVAVVVSTARWQGRLHAALARDGYSGERIAELVSTNWIRTALFTASLVAALYLLWLDRLPPGADAAR
jgi:hypothetical protein